MAKTKGSGRIVPNHGARDLKRQNIAGSKHRREESPSPPPLQKRARDRPKGSKNKSKLPVISIDDDSANEGVENEASYNPLPSRNMRQLSIDDLQPDIEYDDFWTLEDEHNLRNKWIPDDKLMAEASAPEKAVWKRSYQLFNMNPRDLLPDGIEVDTNGLGQDAGMLNWGVGFCVLFGGMLCCPAFENNPIFLRYVIKYALYCRAGKRYGRSKPPIKEEIDSDKNTRVLGLIEGIIGYKLNAQREQQILQILKD